jgi:hypothetical protein
MTGPKIGPWGLVGSVARVAWKSRGFSDQEDPRSIMEDAANPDVPAHEVLTRAKLRSKSGKLVEAVSEAIARRPDGGIISTITSIL